MDKAVKINIAGVESYRDVDGFITYDHLNDYCGERELVKIYYGEKHIGFELTSFIDAINFLKGEAKDEL